MILVTLASSTLAQPRLHRSQAYNGRRNSILYRYIRDTDPEDFYIVFVIEVLEEVNFENIAELRAREQYHIDLLEPPLNEYRAIFDERGREIQREHARKRTSSRVICKNCGMETTRHYLPMHICSGEIIEEKKQLRLERQKELIKRWYKSIVKCAVCDGLYAQGSMSDHLKIHKRDDANHVSHLWQIRTLFDQ